MLRKSIRPSDTIEFDFHVHDKRDDYISRSIVERGIWAPDETAVILDRLKEGDTFVDVGANIGWFAVLASEIVGEDGAVWAYEPDPDNYAILEDNVTHRDSTVAFNVGLSDHEGKIDLFRSPTNLGDHRMFASDDRESVRVNVEKFHCDLDVDFIKIDVQGHEGRVLMGMADYFCDRRNKRPLILMELWPNGMDASGASPEFTLNLLQFYGYRVTIDLVHVINTLRSSSDFEAHTTILFEPK